MELKEIEQKLKQFFEKDKEVEFAFIFGSQVSGKINSESDIDIAVYLDKNKIKDYFEKRVSLITNLEAILKKRIDLIVLNEIKSIFFKFVIIKEGKLVFEKNHSKRVDFELRVMQEYYDFQPFLEQYNKAYLKRELAKYD